MVNKKRALYLCYTFFALLSFGMMDANSQTPAESIETFVPAYWFDSFLCENSSQVHLLTIEDGTLSRQLLGQKQLSSRSSEFNIVVNNGQGIIATQTDAEFPMLSIIAVNFRTGWYSFTTVQIASASEAAGSTYGQCQFE